MAIVTETSSCIPVDHSSSLQRRLPIGAEVRKRGTHFRVWAPDRQRVELLCYARDAQRLNDSPLDCRHALTAEGGGYFSRMIEGVAAGQLYAFSLDGAGPFPDPASRFQPQGPHGPSQVIDPAGYVWNDAGWPGKQLGGQVIYEMHIGTFTREGTFASATSELRELRDAGITVIELMPVADFPGRYGWGYDGVNLFAPARIYGAPDDLRRLIDAAHGLELGVVLDVVYNHLGPDGNYLTQFTPRYFKPKQKTDWGDAINFDGEGSTGVREFYRSNAAYWIAEYHFDGLRLDATHAIEDSSNPRILSEIADAVRLAAQERDTLVIAENESQDTVLVKARDQNGCGIDAVWNDDFHHSARVALTGHNEAYYSDHRGLAQEFISVLKHGFLFQGQHHAFMRRRRGSQSFGVWPARFVLFLENHDHVSASARGLRLAQLTSPGKLRAMTALLLLSPGTPLLFQGQEFGSSKPFPYFADHNPELAAAVRNGRFAFLSQFPSLGTAAMRQAFPDPESESTFEACKLDFSERQSHREIYKLHKDLLSLRRSDPAFQSQASGALDGAVLGDHAFVLRYFVEGGDDRLLIVNLGADLLLSPCPEPLLAPPQGTSWRLAWSSEDPAYGSGGAPEPEWENGFFLRGEAASVLAPMPDVVSR